MVVPLVVAFSVLLQIELSIETRITIVAFVRQFALVIENVHPNGLPRFERLRTERTRHNGAFRVIIAHVVLHFPSGLEALHANGTVAIGIICC